MAKNKSIYDIMGNLDNIQSVDEYEIHARANPSDHYVTPKPTSVHLAESKRFKDAQLLDTAIKTVIGVTKDISSLNKSLEIQKRKEDKDQAAVDAVIQKQAFNVDRNSWTDFKVNGLYSRPLEDGTFEEVRYENMTVQERDLKRDEIFSNSIELSKTLSPVVGRNFSISYSDFIRAEKDKNIPLDTKRYHNLKLDGQFNEYNGREVFPEDVKDEYGFVKVEAYTQDDWNLDLNTDLLDMSKTYTIPMKTINNWVRETAVTGLNNLDTRWYNYAQKYNLFNTADFLNDRQSTNQLRSALNYYQTETAKIQQAEYINTVSDLISQGSEDTTVNTIINNPNYIENESNITNTVYQKMHQAEQTYLDKFMSLPEGEDGYLSDAQKEALNQYGNQVFTNIKNSSKFTNEPNPQHKILLENAITAIKTGDARSLGVINSAVHLDRQYQRVGIEVLKAEDAAIMEAYELFQKTIGSSSSLSQISRFHDNPVQVSSKDEFTVDNFNIDDNIGISTEYGKEGQTWASKFGNMLQKYGVPKDKALEIANKHHNLRYVPVHHDGAYGFDFSFRMPIAPIQDSLTPAFMKKYGITNKDVFITNLTSHTIPHFLNNRIYPNLTQSQREVENVTLVQISSDDNIPVFEIADESGIALNFDEINVVDGKIQYNEDGTPEVIASNKHLILTLDDLASYHINTVIPDQSEQSRLSHNLPSKIKSLTQQLDLLENGEIIDEKVTAFGKTYRTSRSYDTSSGGRNNQEYYMYYDPDLELYYPRPKYGDITGSYSKAKFERKYKEIQKELEPLLRYEKLGILQIEAGKRYDAITNFLDEFGYDNVTNAELVKELEEIRNGKIYHWFDGI